MAASNSVIARRIIKSCILQLHDRRVAVELDELCKGSTLRSHGDMAEVWKLKDGVLNYLNVMHKIWPTDPAAQIIFRVLDEARWGAVAGEDKKLRANLVRKFFNDCAEENAGRAVIKNLCLSFLEAKAKWLRLVEREFPQFSAMSSAGRVGGGVKGGAFGKKFGRGGGGAGIGGSAGGTTAASRAGAGFSGGGSAGGSGGGTGGARQGGPVFSNPLPRFNGLSVCWSFNRTGCSRPAHSPNSCKDPNSPSVFAHVCNFWDPVARQHCYGAHSRSEPGRH